MVNSYTLDSFCQKEQKNKFHLCCSKLLRSFVLLVALIFAGTVSAQTIKQSLLNCTSSDRCTSKDLFVQDVFVDLPLCTTCGTGNTVTAPLKMTIFNGTGSVRTSFSLYGTLSSGASINGISGNIFVCVGPITVTKGPQTFTVGTISFSCGQELTLSNNFLAWTDASGTTADRCNTYSQATKCSDIAPKCGTAASITIRAPLAAKAETVNDPCKNATTPDGSIKITPSGGRAPYSIALYTKGTADCPVTPSGTAACTKTNVTGSATCTGLAAGTYCIYVTDADNCKVPVFTQTIGKDCCTPPGAPTVCQVPADLCSDGKVVLKVSGTVKDAVYHVLQAGSEVTGSPQTASADGSVLSFKVVPGGGDIEVYGVSSLNGTTCTGASTKSDCKNSPNGIGVCSSGSLTMANLGKTSEQEIFLKNQSQPSVIAAPNPFNDRIRFSMKSDISGPGSLELYNTLGQKVKTVFQGYVEKGVTKTIEYSLPGSQRQNLIYLFRIGDQKVSGKLIGLK